jgi:HTH-type transcriptional regulator/antitoxin MqsA
VISEVFEYGDKGDSVLVRTQDVPVEDCEACGESFSGPKAARIRHEAIGRALGLLPPQDIRAIRERLGQSHEHFAKLLGVGVDRLTQWEDGTLWQDRTADRLMRLLDRRKENLIDLESLIATSPPSDTDNGAEGQAQPSRKARRRIILPQEREQSGL